MALKHYLFIGALVFILVVLIRESSIDANKVPLEITHKIRNISAQEEEWQIATTAQVGDVLEHFLLVHLPENFDKNLEDINISHIGYDKSMYREKTFKSISEGIGQEGAQIDADAFFSKAGLLFGKIMPGEFIDIKWQSRIESDLEFLETKISVSAEDFSAVTAKTLVSLFSTIERSKTKQEISFFLPKIIGMNPRVSYEDISTGVLIAGQDLGGIKQIYIAEGRKNLVWRVVSNDLIEASIPAGLLEGDYEIEFVDYKNTLLDDKLRFSINPSHERTVILSTTPSVIFSGAERIIVLQGIHLKEDSSIKLQNNSKDHVVVLENIEYITDKVISAKVPEDIKTGDYSIFVGKEGQEVKLTVK